MSTLLWATPFRRSHHFHARSPWRTSSLRAPVSIFKRRFEDFCARGIYRLGSTKLCGSFYTAVRGVQKAEIKTKAPVVDKAPRDGLLAFYADHFVVPLPEGHRFPMTKYRATRLLLEGDEQLRDILVTMPASVASIDDVCLVHDEGYVQRFISGGLTEKEQRAVGFPWSVEHRQRSLASTGGTVAAMHTVMQGKRRVAANIAGGTHHAFAGHGEGFCVFNDIAVASAACLRDYPANCNLQTPILVVDLDVHQGNGTSKLFENDDRVITFDMHGAGNYPWKTKTKSNYDIGLPDGTEDEDYLATLAEWLPHLIELHEPGLVFFQAGVDALKEDSFGRLAMTRQGLLKRNNMVYSACIERNLPLVITMGGGYSRPSDASIEAHADVYRSAALRYSAARGKAQVPFRKVMGCFVDRCFPYLAMASRDKFTKVLVLSTSSDSQAVQIRNDHLPLLEDVGKDLDNSIPCKDHNCTPRKCHLQGSWLTHTPAAGSLSTRPVQYNSSLMHPIISHCHFVQPRSKYIMQHQLAPMTHWTSRDSLRKVHLNVQRRNPRCWLGRWPKWWHNP